jgi:peptide/nickel transport system ATP-binding protein
MLIGSAIKLETPAEAKIRMRQARRSDPASPLLTVQDLTKDFSVSKGFFRRETTTLKAVDSVSLELREGENLGIVGESGSGKTTLGRCIVRMIEPSAGAVAYRRANGEMVDIRGMTKADLRKIYREIRMIFQDPFGSLNPRMTIEQIVGEPLLMMGWKPKAIRERVIELMERVDLKAEYLERYPHAFSGGQRQRIGIARALAPNPRIIIADEATSALDVSLRAQVLDLLLSLQEQMGLSFIFISHDISVIRYFCDRVAVMYHGKVVEVGDVMQVCDAPRHAYTKALLSAVPRADPTRRRIHERHRYVAEM